jgi:hypothetical protein
VDKPTLALTLTFFVHLVGIVALLWLALSGDGSSWRDWWPRDEDDGPEDDGPPLPDADPSGARLRTEHDAVPRRRQRRPEHAPTPSSRPSRQPSARP